MLSSHGGNASRDGRHRLKIKIGVFVALGAAAALGILVSTSGGNSHGGVHDARAVGDQEAGGPPPNWDHVFISEQSVVGVSAAASKVGFAPVVPGSLGQPKSVVVRADVSGTDQQALGLVFDGKPYGRFIAIEEPTKMSQADLEQVVATCDPSQGCQGTRNIVNLSDGTRAVTIDGPGSNGVMWLRNGVRFDVFGPPDTFSPDDALAAANAFVSVS